MKISIADFSSVADCLLAEERPAASVVLPEMILEDWFQQFSEPLKINGLHQKRGWISFFVQILECIFLIENHILLILTILIIACICYLGH